MRMLMQYGGRDGDRSGRTDRGGRDDGLRNRDDYMEPEMRRRGRRRRRSDGTFMMLGGGRHEKMEHGLFSSSSGGDDFDPQLVHETCEKIKEKLQNPPQTWYRYLEDDRIIPIIKMEYDELKRAIHEVKEGHRSPRAIDKELIHLAAALVCAHVELMEEEE